MDQLTINADVLKVAKIKTPGVDQFHDELADWQQRHDAWVQKVRTYFVDGYDVPVAELICFGEAAEFERSQLEAERTELAWARFEIWRGLGTDFKAASDAALANQLEARKQATDELAIQGITPDVFDDSRNPDVAFARFEQRLKDQPCMLIAAKRVRDAQAAVDGWETSKALPPSADVCKVEWPKPSTDDEKFIDMILKRNVSGNQEIGIPASLVFPELSGDAKPVSWSANAVFTE